MHIRNILAATAAFLFLQTAAATHPKRETRAVWLTTIGGLDWPRSYASTPETAQRQKRELTGILDRLQAANINTVLLQTRIRATTIYPSEYEPWDGCLSGMPGRSPGYDPLAFAVEECHKRGMQLHAWVVAVPVGKWNGKGCSELRRKHPSIVKKIGDEGYMDPGSPLTAGHIADICREITSGYDIDGIHLDYIRYHENWRIGIPRDKARENITRIVREVHSRVKETKPWVMVSCSPVGKFQDLPRHSSRGWNAYHRVCQDAQGWLRDGIMDALFPMMYFRGNNFYPFALDWNENSHGRIIAPGLGIYFMSHSEKDWPLADIVQEAGVLRSQGMGQAYFRSAFLTGDTKGLYSFLSRHFYKYPALPQAMDWLRHNAPVPPAGIRVSSGKLVWTAVDTLSYNLYSSRTYPVDTGDASNLVMAGIRGAGVELGGMAKGRYFAVTASDRYGNESSPAEWPAQPHRTATEGMLKVSDGKVEIPSAAYLVDKPAMVVETLQGCAVWIAHLDCGKASISHIPPGIYRLKAVNRNGQPHHLGWFMVEMQ